MDTEQIKDTVCNYFIGLPVREVYLCGSYARGKATEDSDIDLLLFLASESNFKPDLYTWQTDLEHLLGKEVELFQGADKPFAGYKFAFYERMYKEKVLLYSKHIIVL